VTHTNIFHHRTTTGYPLKIEASNVLVETSPFNKDFVLKMLPKINYEVVVQASRQLASGMEGKVVELPETLPSEPDDQFLETLHHVLLDIHLIEGFLICPSSGRRFPVRQSIPNMILHEDEI
jgi:multifunctional methyltransferase subunit TRM112